MDALTQLFASKAKIKILRILYTLAKPVALRQIASLANLPVYSVQYGLKQLLEEKFLLKKNNKNQTLYSLNVKHPYFQTLATLFITDARLRLKNRSVYYSTKAKQVLNFITQSQDMFKSVKSNL